MLPLVGTMNIVDYIYDPGLYKYIGANLIFMNFLAPELPGVFQGNAVHAVNGALWTLKVELGFYIFVPICIWIFTKFGRLKTLLLFYVLSVIYSSLALYIAESRNMDSFIEISRQMPGQMTYFIAGAILFYYFDYFKRHILYLTILGIGIFCLSFYTMDLILRPIGLALGGMGIAFGPYLGRFGKYGDFSYGIYIVHFPILQTMISLNILQDDALSFILLAASFVLIAAVLMWHLVEKAFLRRSSHYRQEEVVAVAS
jgi:peptidoglycan/LPS O-acetylase OafA/YrhL